MRYVESEELGAISAAFRRIMHGLTVKHFVYKLSIRSISPLSLSIAKTIADKATNGKLSDELEAQPTKRNLGSLLPPPADTSLIECARRNRILRSYLLRRNWECDLEFKVLQSLLAVPTPYFWLPFHSKYPLVYDFEWETFHLDAGHGDLIFTDGLGGFLIVEAKSVLTFGYGSVVTQKGNRTKKRRLARQQCLRNAQLWHSSHPNVMKTEGVVVTEEGILHHVTILERSVGGTQKSERMAPNKD